MKICGNINLPDTGKNGNIKDEGYTVNHLNSSNDTYKKFGGILRSFSHWIKIQRSALNN